MTRFTDYAAAAARGIVLVWKTELVSPDGRILATSDQPAAGSNVIRWGAELRPLSWANDRMSDTNATLSVVVTDPALIPDNPGSLLHPDSGNLVRIYAGLYVGTAPRFYTVATLAIADVDAAWSEGVAAVSVSLVDRARPLQSEVEKALPFTDGTTVETVVRQLASQVLNSPYQIAATGYTLPEGSIEPGVSRGDVIEKMLGGCGHELVTNADGFIYTQPIPETTGTGSDRWIYGDNGYPIDNLTRAWSTKTPQSWRVEGGSFQNEEDPVTVTVYDTDPTSQGYYDGTKAPQVGISRFPWVRTPAQGAAAGYGQIRRHGTGKMIVEFQCSPNPAMAKDDLVELTVAGLKIDGVFRVIGKSLPILVDGTMQVVCRHVWDPQANYRGIGSEGGTGAGVASILDDFNRANQNLEDSGEGGSINWTEFGWSWAVVGEKAVQRYNNGWSFARWNDPLTSSDHFAEFVVGPTPGHQVGPLIRSDGAWNGYSAVTGADGIIRLVSWVNGKQAGALAEYNYGSNLTGTTVRVTGAGNTLTVAVNGTTVLTTPVVQGDAQRTPVHSGTYVGMVGYGATGSAAPTADDFAAGV